MIDGDKYDFVADPACGEQIVQEIKMRAKKMTEEADAQSIRYTTNNPKAKESLQLNNIKTKQIAHSQIFLCEQHLA